MKWCLNVRLDVRVQRQLNMRLTFKRVLVTRMLKRFREIGPILWKSICNFIYLTMQLPYGYSICYFRIHFDIVYVN